MSRNGYETELIAAKVAVEEAKENRFVTELEDKSSQVAIFCTFSVNKVKVTIVYVFVEAEGLDLFQNFLMGYS